MRRLTTAMTLALMVLLTASLALANPLAGTWTGGDNSSGRWVVVFNANGTFTRQVDMGQKGTHREQGQYRVQGNMMQVQVQGRQPYTLQYQLQGNTLTLYEDGQPLAKLVRSTGQPQQQQMRQQGRQRQMQPQSGKGQMVAQMGLPQTLTMKPYRDKTEAAFSVLVPKGWQTAGGVIRMYPQQTGGPFNAMKAKFSFWVFSPDKRVVMHLFPTWYYMDPNYKPILQGQVGKSYQGATVKYGMTPQQFAMKVAFPEMHKKVQVSGVRVISQENLPRLAQVARKMNPAVRMGVKITAGQVKVTYTENGVQYLEIYTVIIEHTGQLVAGLWSNSYTQVVRCPVNEVNKWGPIMAAVQGSFKIDMKWLTGELKGQTTRQGKAAQTWGQIQQLGRQITQSRQNTTALINYHQQLNLKGQQLFTNPHTGESEVGPIWYERRLQGPDGTVIYTNDQSVNPGGGWKASQPRSISAD